MPEADADADADVQEIVATLCRIWTAVLSAICSAWTISGALQWVGTVLLTCAALYA
jgi:hypothetical protein